MLKLSYFKILWRGLCQWYSYVIFVFFITMLFCVMEVLLPSYATPQTYDNNFLCFNAILLQQKRYSSMFLFLARVEPDFIVDDILHQLMILTNDVL